MKTGASTVLSTKRRIRRRIGSCAILVALAVGSPAPGQEPAKGKLLVASEALRDPNFERTVVLLLNHDSETGTLGVVLNRPSAVAVERLLPHFEGLDVEDSAEQRFFLGGPVEVLEMSMLFTTSRDHSGHLPVLGEVYAGWDDDLLRLMVNEPLEGDRFRLYAGHAGWAPGQLEAEIAARAWHVLPAVEADIFADDIEGLWSKLIRRTRVQIALR